MSEKPAVLTRNSTPCSPLPTPCAAQGERSRAALFTSPAGSLLPPWSLPARKASWGAPTRAMDPAPMLGVWVPAVLPPLVLKFHWVMICAGAPAASTRPAQRLIVRAFFM